MLVVVENRDIADLFQFLLDLEAAGSRDIFQIDAAKAASEKLNSFYDVVDLFAANTQRESIDVAKAFDIPV